MDDLINQLTSIITTWQSGAVLAALILAVNLATNLAKLQAVAKYVPAVVLPWVAAGLGSVSAFLAALASGKPVVQAVVSGLLIGLGAIGTHELVSSARPAVRAARTKAKLMMKHGGNAALVLIVVIVGSTTMISCMHGECAQPANAGSLKCTVVNGLVDCTAPELQPTIEGFLPIAKSYLGKLTNADGSVDWDTYADVLASSGRGDALCIFERVVAWFLTSKTMVASNVPHVDVETNRAAATAARLKRFGALKVKLADGAVK
jgi:hypothetical protein